MALTFAFVGIDVLMKLLLDFKAVRRRRSNCLYFSWLLMNCCFESPDKTDFFFLTELNPQCLTRVFLLEVKESGLHGILHFSLFVWKRLFPCWQVFQHKPSPLKIYFIRLHQFLHGHNCWMARFCLVRGYLCNYMHISGCW